MERERLGSNLRAVRQRIGAACARAGRDESEVALIAVTKTHPAETIRGAMSFGLTVFGENKVQEAEGKIAEVGRDAAEWHLIGHLQSNKARKAVQLFDVIHSVDSAELADRLERICTEEGRERLRVLMQVDLAGEETKSGIPEADALALAEHVSGLRHVKLTGLMVLPPYWDDPELTRPYFRRLRELRDQMASRGMFESGGGELSMGMSHDLEAAIEEGATMIRIGTAIFGEREQR